MSYADKKTVWILGSGFSRPLGGPLLADLLSMRGMREFDRFQSSSAPKYYLQNLFEGGLRSPEKLGKPTNHYQLWSDAEEFLDFVDTAAQGASGLAKLLMNVVDQTGPRHAGGLPGIRRAAVQSVAGDCSFDQFTDVALEGWEPYRDWAKTLTEHDSLITFNYDTVVERLGDYLREKGGSIGLSPQSLVVPWDKPDFTSRVTRLYKLHGSVSWTYNPNEPDEPGYKSVAKWWEEEAPSLPLIGTPGPSKQQFKDAHFKQLWDLAMAKIEAADVIVFVGYRFPPSDSQARKEILGAIAANDQPYLRIHTVLGPNTNGEDPIRLARMLSAVLETKGRKLAPDDNTYCQKSEWPESYRVIRQPLYAQDFFTILSENFLNGKLVAAPATPGVSWPARGK